MKSHLSFYILCVICLSFSCKQRQTANAITTDTKTIPFDYDDKMLKLIIFKGTLNDSISLNVMFDTGIISKEIFLSDSLSGLLVDTIVNLQAGAYKSSFSILPIDRNNPIFRHLDAIIGWQFFKDKIIEISYQHKTMRELDATPASTEFFPIKMDSRLTIPMKIYVQGKCIEDNILIDTGSNGYVSIRKNILEKYKIDIPNTSYAGASITSGGLLPVGTVTGDSIKLGKFTLPDVIVSFSTSGNTRPNLLGNKVLEHFTVILDFKNFFLYLKPN